MHGGYNAVSLMHCGMKRNDHIDILARLLLVVDENIYLLNVKGVDPVPLFSLVAVAVDLRLVVRVLRNHSTG